MNTVAKGTLFEDRVFNAIKRELVSERLGLLPNSCKIFKKKKYYSKIRKEHIEIDISIEVFLPNATNWSFLWAIECKDYKNALPVNDVEEFHAKIQQVAGDNVKATLILSGALQKGAFEYCKSLGIGVVRLLPDSEIECILREPEVILYSAEQCIEADADDRAIEKETEASSQAIEAEISRTVVALTDPEFESVNDFFAFQNNCIYNEWFSLIKATLSPAAS